MFWRVQSYNNGQGGVASVLPDIQLTATFGDDGGVTGNAGCNGYRGPFTVSGTRITFGSIISTKRACTSQPLNQQEQAFLTALNASTSFGFVGGRLTLRDDAGARRCRRHANPAGPAEHPTGPGRTMSPDPSVWHAACHIF